MSISDALQKLVDAVRVRHFSRSTEKAYAPWLQSYMGAVQKYPPGMTSEKQVGRFLTEQAHRGVAASTPPQTPRTRPPQTSRMLRLPTHPTPDDELVREPLIKEEWAQKLAVRTISATGSAWRTDEQEVWGAKEPVEWRFVPLVGVGCAKFLDHRIEE
jgi:hypothetical protein